MLHPLRCDGYAPIHLAASDCIVDKLCDALAALRKVRIQEIAQRHSVRITEAKTRTLTPDRLAKYRRVVAAVHAGRTWEQAAFSEGVRQSAVQAWWGKQKKLAAARAAAAPIPKPSGALI